MIKCIKIIAGGNDAMEKIEFLNGLRQTMIGEVDQKVIDDNIRYYDDYIMMEARKGKAEEEVLETLGDPRLIAKTIIDTNQPLMEQNAFDPYEEEMEGKPKVFTLPGWAMLILYGIAAIVLIGIIGSVVSALLPIIIPVIIIALIIGFFRRR